MLILIPKKKVAEIHWIVCRTSHVASILSLWNAAMKLSAKLIRLDITSSCFDSFLNNKKKLPGNYNITVNELGIASISIWTIPKYQIKVVDFVFCHAQIIILRWHITDWVTDIWIELCLDFERLDIQ